MSDEKAIDELYHNEKIGHEYAERLEGAYKIDGQHLACEEHAAELEAHIRELELLLQEIKPIKNMAGDVFGIVERPTRVLKVWFAERNRLLTLNITNTKDGREHG